MITGRRRNGVMVKLKKEPAIVVEYVADYDANDSHAAHRAILELARALARIAAREDDAAEGGV
jgi:hypothetical protein